MGITTFFAKHTRHSTPIFIRGACFVGGPFLITLKAELTLLQHSGDTSVLAWTCAFVQASVIALGALGAFMDRTYSNFREEKKKLTETEFARQRAGKDRAEGDTELVLR